MHFVLEELFESTGFMAEGFAVGVGFWPWFVGKVGGMGFSGMFWRGWRCLFWGCAGIGHSICGPFFEIEGGSFFSVFYHLFGFRGVVGRSLRQWSPPCSWDHVIESRGFGVVGGTWDLVVWDVIFLELLGSSQIVAWGRGWRNRGGVEGDCGGGWVLYKV